MLIGLLQKGKKGSAAHASSGRMKRELRMSNGCAKRAEEGGHVATRLRQCAISTESTRAWAIADTSIRV